VSASPPKTASDAGGIPVDEKVVSGDVLHLEFLPDGTFLVHGDVCRPAPCSSRSRAFGDQPVGAIGLRVSRSNFAPSVSTWRRTFVMQTG